MRFVSSRVALGLVLLSASSVACGDEGPTLPTAVRVTDGDGQVAPAGTLLPRPITITVVHADGAPAAGIPVEWQAEADDRVLAPEPVTDANGQARARWQLGSNEGERRLEAILPGLDPAVFTAVAEPAGVVPFGETVPLRFDTYDGSGQVVHPDFVATPGEVFGRPFHLAITPYPFANPAFENPSFFESDRRTIWSLPTGGPNPVVLPENGYLSDPDLVFVPEVAELWLYYREVSRGNIVRLVRTADGVHWSGPVTVLTTPSHNAVSPSIIRRSADDWWMYVVNAGPSGCDATSTGVDVRRSTDGVHWSEPARVAMPLPGLWPWHVDVQWIPSRSVFWALFNAKPEKGCATQALYLAESADGLTWSVLSRPVVTAGVTPTLEHVVYRSTFEYDERSDAITFWMSGARYEQGHYVWGAVVERRRRTEVFTPLASLVDPRTLPPPPAPLTDWP